MRKIFVILSCLVLSACLDSDHEDMRQWMNDESKKIKGKVLPLPTVKPYESVGYDVAELVDPFNQSRLGLDMPTTGQGTGVEGPDITRPKQPLEAYPLETLKYVGLITKKTIPYAIIAADQALHQVEVGNYMGQNFGKISEINETELVLIELVQDSLGEWSERNSTLFLQEQEGVKK